MSHELAGAIVLAVAVLLIGVGVWAWLRRRRRDARLVAPVGELADAAVRLEAAALYVATTRHGEPLERLAIDGLGFRAAAEIVVTDTGVTLDLAGGPRLAIERNRLVAVEQATVAIDTVAEQGGLVRLAWRIDADTIIDSYLRPRDRSARAVVEAIRPLVPVTLGPSTGDGAATGTGTEAAA